MSFDIPEPCSENWDAMAPRRGGRYCERCEHVVVDFSKMTRREAERRLDREPSLCGNVAFDQHGDPLFRPEQRRAPHWAGGLVLIAALSAAGCGSRDDLESPIAQVEADPPCELPPPASGPMLPIGSDVVEPLATGPVSVVVLDESSDAAVPTAEQEALTARKHRPTPVFHGHRRGRIRRLPPSF